MAKKTTRIGGSFAPPLSDEILDTYEDLIGLMQPRTKLREALDVLLNCARQWWNQPESTGGITRPHPVGVGTIVDLDEPIAAALYDHIPWDYELKAYGELFEDLDATSQKELRDAAFHLLWFGWELTLDREPITADKL